MLLQQVTLQDFRNITLARLGFCGRRQFLLGANGQGKTNVLEALGLLTALRSFRTSEAGQLVRSGQPGAAVSIQLWHDRQGQSSVTFRLGAGGKEIAVDQERIVRLGDFIGRFPTVVFSSQDQALVRGAPAARRRWLDLALAATDGGYLRVLQAYHRALASRNVLLKRGDAASDAELLAFERTMAPAAAHLAAARAVGLAEIAACLARHYALVAAAPEEEVGFAYAPDCAGPSEGSLLALWSEQRARDRQWRTTGRGPHRDDFEFVLRGLPARHFASEGQQRLLVLALRLAQAEWGRARTGVDPVLLADDVLGELDPQRRERFWSALAPGVQVVATGTSLPEGLSRGDWQVFRVEAGRVSEEPLS